MIAFTTLIYATCIFLFFAKLKIVKPTAKSIGVAVLIGIVLIGGIIIGWQFSAPNSSQVVVSRYTVQIVPQVKGPIEKIHAAPNVPLVKGEDILFEIQKEPFEYALNQVTAQLAGARNNIEQLEASILVAKATVKETEATMLAAKAEFDVGKETEALNPDAISKLAIVQLEQLYQAAVAANERAIASVGQAEAALIVGKDNVENLEAQLDTAKFNLEQCTVYAPADGFVTNWQAREGTMAVNMPFAPVGTFIDMSKVNIVASYPQNVLKNVRADDPVEVCFKSHPGQVFSGKVTSVIPVTGEGQFTTSGQLMSASDISSSGMAIVKIELDNKEIADELGLGTAGSVVIYSSKGKPFHVISKVVVRMNSWMYYLIPG